MLGTITTSFPTRKFWGRSPAIWTRNADSYPGGPTQGLKPSNNCLIIFGLVNHFSVVYPVLYTWCLNVYVFSYTYIVVVYNVYYFLQGGPRPVMSRVITPLIGVITPFIIGMAHLVVKKYKKETFARLNRLWTPPFCSHFWALFIFTFCEPWDREWIIPLPTQRFCGETPAESASDSWNKVWCWW